MDVDGIVRLIREKGLVVRRLLLHRSDYDALRAAMPERALGGLPNMFWTTPFGVCISHHPFVEKGKVLVECEDGSVEYVAF
jgi:hypothetical protein